MEPLDSCPRCGATRDWRGVCSHCLLRGALARAEATDGPPPAGRLGAYTLHSELGRGGMGRVWRARQAGLDRDIALKTLRAGVGADQAARDRFRREALAAGRLRHAGIVTVHEVGEADGELYLAMELVRGETLAQRLKMGPLPPRDAAGLLREVADAVQHAHEAGVIHRDVKPSNILLDADRNGAPRLTDFGIARLAGGDEASLTCTLEGLGTLAYLAPEQAAGRGAEQGPATDVYSLGAVLYHCLTGRPPFLSESVAAVLRLVIETEPPGMRSLNPSIPRDLETIALHCLEKHPSRRYPSAGDLALELGRWLRDEPIHARATGLWSRGWKWCRRRPAVALLSAITVLLILTALAVRELGHRRLAKSITQLELAQAENLFARHEVGSGIAQLCSTLRRVPDESVAGTRLWSALNHRTWLRPLRQLEGSNGRLNRFAPDSSGKYAAVFDVLGNVEVFELDRWRPQGPKLYLGGSTAHLALSRDGGIASAMTLDGQLAVWSPQSGTQFPNPPVAGLRCMDLSLDGRFIAVGTTQGELFFWPTGTTNIVRCPSAGSLTEVRFSPNSDRIVCRSTDRSWRLWEVPTGREISGTRMSESIEKLAYSQDGDQFASGDDSGVVRLWSSNDGALLGEFQTGGRITVLAFGEGGGKIVTAGFESSLQIWQQQTNKGFRQLAKWTAPAVIAVAQLDPEAHRMITCTVRGQWRVWDLVNLRPATEWFPHGHGGHSAAFGPDGSSVFTFSRECELLRWQLSSVPRLRLLESQTGRLPLDNSIERLAFSTAGGLLLTAGNSREARLWSVGAPTSALPILLGNQGEPIERAQFNQDRSLTMVWSPKSPQITIHSTSPTQPPSTIATVRLPTGNVSAATWVSRSDSIFTACSDGRIAEWNGRDGTSIRQLESAPKLELHSEMNPDGTPADLRPRRGEEYFFSELRASPDGRYLGGVAAYHGFRTWRLADGRLLPIPTNNFYIATRMAWHPKLPIYATACWAYTARVWDAETGIAVGPDLVHADGVNHVAFSPIGDRLVTASLDGTARIWDWKSGRPLTPSLNHGGHVYSAEFSPDGKQIVTASGDGSARVWDAQTGQPLTEPLQLAGPGFRSPDDEVVEAHFSPDGRQVVAMLRRGNLMSFEFRRILGPTHPEVLDLAERLGGVKLGNNGIQIPTGSLPYSVPRIGDQGPWAEWLQRLYGAVSSPE